MYDSISSVPVTDLRNFNFDGRNVYIKNPIQKSWIEKENTKTIQLLNETPLYETLKKRFQELAVGSPAPRVDSDAGLIFIKAGSLVIESNGIEVLLVDKASLQGAVIVDFRVSPDGTKVAYAANTGGSDSNYWSIYDLLLKKVLEDQPTRVRIYDFNWSPESDGFYYSKWPILQDEFNFVSNQTQRKGGVDIAYHKLNTSANEDQIVFANQYQSTNFGMFKVAGENIYITHRTKLGFTHPIQALFGQKQSSGRIKWNAFKFPRNTLGRFIFANKEHSFFLSSELGNNYGIVAYSNQTGRRAQVLVPATSKIMAQAQLIGSHIVIQYFDHEFNNTIHVVDLSGTVKAIIDFAELGLSSRGVLAQSFNARPGSDRFEFTYSSVDQPSVTISYQIASKKIEIRKSALANTFDRKLVASEVTYVKNEEGLSIPVMLYYRAGFDPIYAGLTYYGSNGVVNAPAYNREFQMQIEMGAVLVLVGPRGGGDLGAKWYQEGMDDRMNTVSDVAIVARWIKTRFPSIQGRVVGSGRSYGGMLTYALAVHSPNEFTALVPVVGIGDVEYYKTDYHGSIGWDDLGYKRDKYGHLIVDTKTNNKVINFSPYQNIKQMKSSTAVLSISGAQDERVGPHQGYVMTEALKDHIPESATYFLEQSGGHNAKLDTPEKLAFYAKILGLTGYQIIFK